MRAEARAQVAARAQAKASHAANATKRQRSTAKRRTNARHVVRLRLHQHRVHAPRRRRAQRVARIVHPARRVGAAARARRLAPRARLRCHRVRRDRFEAHTRRAVGERAQLKATLNVGLRTHAPMHKRALLVCAVDPTTG